MSMTPETPTPDYGEPWHLTDSDTAHAISRNDELALFPLRNMERAVACVNACVGMTDPAAEIEVMREAVQIAKDLAEWSARYPRGMIYSASNRKMDEELVELEKRATTLSNLQHFLPNATSAKP